MVIVHGKLHEYLRQTAFLPLRLCKTKSRNIGIPLISTTRNCPEYNSRVMERTETMPRQSVCSKNNLILSVLPKYIKTCKEDNFILCCCKARSKTSNVPEPLSRSTKGKWNNSSGVISSPTANLLPVRTTATSSSSKK